MFSGCVGLKEFKLPRVIKIKDSHTKEPVLIRNAAYMFQNCANLDIVDFSNYRFGQPGTDEDKAVNEYDPNVEIKCNVSYMFMVNGKYNDHVSEIKFNDNWNKKVSLYDMYIAKYYNDTKYLTPIRWINTSSAASYDADLTPYHQIELRNDSNDEQLYTTYKRAELTVTFKDDNINTYVQADNEPALAWDEDFSGYAIGAGSGYTAYYKVGSCDGNYPYPLTLNIRVEDNNNPSIYHEYQNIYDVVRYDYSNLPIYSAGEFGKGWVTDWKIYLNWDSSEMEVLAPETST